MSRHRRSREKIDQTFPSETLRVFGRFDYVRRAVVIRIIIDDTILSLNKTAWSRGPARVVVLTLSPQLAIEPPEPETYDRSKNGDDATQHYKRKETQHNRGPNYESTDENNEYVRNGVAGRQTTIAR